MEHIKTTVLRKESIAPAWWQLTVLAPSLASRLIPGQFLLARCGNFVDSYLRRPLFPQLLEDDHLSFLLHPDADPGYAWLAARQVGDELDLIGPLGNGFGLPDSAQNIVFVSDSQNIGPLLAQMTRAITAGRAVTLALGASRAAALYPMQRLPTVVEVQAATLDGSLGYRGPITGCISDSLAWADMVCAIGSPNLYETLKKQIESVRFRLEPNYLYGLVLNKLILCGFGACFGCVIETKQNTKLACLDGPIFDLTEIADFEQGSL